MQKRISVQMYSIKCIQSNAQQVCSMRLLANDGLSAKFLSLGISPGWMYQVKIKYLHRDNKSITQLILVLDIASNLMPVYKFLLCFIYTCQSQSATAKCMMKQACFHCLEECIITICSSRESMGGGKWRLREKITICPRSI